MLNPLLTPSRLNLQGCQQTYQMNMLLQQFLMRAAMMSQQQFAFSQPTDIPSFYGGMHTSKTAMIPHSLSYGVQQKGVTIPNSLLTPPLSEPNGGSSTGNPSPPTFANVPTPEVYKDAAATGQKRQHKSQNLKQKKECKRLKTGKKQSQCEQSPISGIMIKRVSRDAQAAATEEASSPTNGDIESKYNVVDKSEESKKMLSRIQNVIGDYVCRLCETKFADVYHLAEHRCPSIIYIDYKCPECFKAFSCPANLASHRRWHKPKQEPETNASAVISTGEKRT
ncbi:transcription factor egl-46-like [Watersipora subatra]|uniref:transcription factor egl-46-like n=1 Tax=Watersipora subatra TaxID=2589382 RepID=UPI00355C526B